MIQNFKFQFQKNKGICKYDNFNKFRRMNVKTLVIC